MVYFPRVGRIHHNHSPPETTSSLTSDLKRRIVLAIQHTCIVNRSSFLTYDHQKNLFKYYTVLGIYMNTA